MVASKPWQRKPGGDSERGNAQCTAAMYRAGTCWVFIHLSHGPHSTHERLKTLASPRCSTSKPRPNSPHNRTEHVWLQVPLTRLQGPHTRTEGNPRDPREHADSPRRVHGHTRTPSRTCARTRAHAHLSHGYSVTLQRTTLPCARACFQELSHPSEPPFSHNNRCSKLLPPTPTPKAVSHLEDLAHRKPWTHRKRKPWPRGCGTQWCHR